MNSPKKEYTAENVQIPTMIFTARSNPIGKDVTKYGATKKEFQQYSSFDRQLKAFMQRVLSNKKDAEDYRQVQEDLDKLVHEVFPHAKIYPFGSTVNGLSFKDSDLDLYIDIGEPEKTMSSKKIIRSVLRLIYREKNTFSHVENISMAKVPIIKFQHRETGVPCDVNFVNEIGPFNSQLVKHYLTYDERLKPLVVIIKCWFRKFGNPNRQIRTYPLAMLIFFYLQQPSVRILPTVRELQHGTIPILRGNWQVNFNEYLLFPNTNSQTIPELLCGFFEFYSKFDFSANIVCPYDGQIHPRNAFWNVDDVPESMWRYKVNAKENDFQPLIPPAPKRQKVMVTQDPFRLNENMTGIVVTNRQLKKWQQSCAFAARICGECIAKGQTSLLLMKLRTSRPPVTINDLLIELGKYSDSIILEDCDSSNDAERYRMRKRILLEKLLKSLKDELEQVCGLRVKEVTGNTVENGFDDETSDNEEADEDDDFENGKKTGEKIQTIFHCVGKVHTEGNEYSVTLSKRKCAKLSAEEKEILIAKKQQESRERYKNVIVDFQCRIDFQKDSTLRVKFFNLNKKNPDDRLKPILRQMKIVRSVINSTVCRNLKSKDDL